MHASPTPNLFITGATGFIGGALAARLVRTPAWDHAVFLVRAPHKEDGLARLAHNLRLHGASDDDIDRLHPHQIICGDLMHVADWIDDPRLAHIEAVVNSAAVASFGKHPSIFPTNLDGVLAMAHGLNRRTQLKRFMQISTGMACGVEAPMPVHENHQPSADAPHYLDYTQSKYLAEQRLKAELPHLPLVVVRPTIVVGHTQLGCMASGSIYWVFRLARALRAFPCSLKQKIDVIPVDYCAQAIEFLLQKKRLSHAHYHIAAGEAQSCSFGAIDRAISAAMKQAPMHDYQQKSPEEFGAMQNSFKDRIGPCNKRIVLKAIHAYGHFAAQEVMFRNQHLLDEGFAPPPRFTDYAGLCELTSQDVNIAEQMRHDYK